VQNAEDDRDWYFEFWFLIFLDRRRNDKNGLFWTIAWICSATCTIVGSSAGDGEQAKLDGLLPVFVPLSQIWFVFVFSF
jgi:hypothetical protein